MKLLAETPEAKPDVKPINRK